MVPTMRGCQPPAKRSGMAVTLTMGETKKIKYENTNSKNRPDNPYHQFPKLLWML